MCGAKSLSRVANQVAVGLVGLPTPSPPHPTPYGRATPPPPPLIVHGDMYHMWVSLMPRAPRSVLRTPSQEALIRSDGHS
jgi:hypothetical protein